MSQTAPGVTPVNPRPPFPLGWYRVAWSDDLTPGSVLERLFLGGAIVAFRTDSGTAAVVAAHCPHLGANLGRGGTVVGEAIRCPFHGLRWTPEGTCTGSDYPGDPPYDQTLRSFPTVERAGAVLAWFDPAAGPPRFHLPDLDVDGWTPWSATTIPLAVHVETIHENGVDTAHFATVHGFRLSDFACAERGHVFHSEFNFAVPNFLREGPAEITTFFDTDAHGPGYVVSVNTAEAVDLHYRVLLLPTPTEAGHLELTIATSVRRPAEGDRIGGVAVDEVADFMHRGAVGGVRQDQPIWEGLRYVDQPRLVRGDGPIPRFRHWARQFHPA